jgi:hypothetical protein
MKLQNISVSKNVNTYQKKLKILKILQTLLMRKFRKFHLLICNQKKKEVKGKVIPVTGREGP